MSLKSLEYKLYNLLENKNYEEIEVLIKNIKITDIISNGLLSNLLKYYIIIENKELINLLLNNNKLMKRDYLLLSQYYYNKNYNITIDIFNKIDFTKLETKDIDFIIINKMEKLLYLLDGQFISSSINLNTFSDKLKLYYIPEININIYLNLLEKKFSSKILNKLKNFKLLVPNITYIIDAGNILYSDCGNITIKSINGLKLILQKLDNLIIIIHEKHFSHPLITELISHYDYYLTPYKYYDDIFIIWLFLKFYTKCYIISNDKFEDHMYYLNFNRNDKNLLLQQIINFSIKNYNLIDIPTYSKCIQIIDNDIYIPN